jgi:hypothetical protein
MNTNIYSHLETSGGQSSKPYLNVVHFLNTRTDKKSVAAQDSCFPALVSNTCCSIARPDTSLCGQMTFDHLTFGQMMLCLIFFMAFLVYFLVFSQAGEQTRGVCLFFIYSISLYHWAAVAPPYSLWFVFSPHIQPLKWILIHYSCTWYPDWGKTNWRGMPQCNWPPHWASLFCKRIS